MSAGNLELNNHRLDLGSSGMIMGEQLNARITGTKGGVVTATAVLNAPQNVNPGNIGVELSSAANLGITVITRGHVQQTNAGRQGIQRYYDVEPAFNASDIALRFHYLEPELGGNNEAELVLWSGNKSSFNWAAVGKENSDAATNWIAKNNISGMNRFTLGIAEKGVLANSVVKGLGDARAGISFMQAYPNPARNQFTVSVYSDANKQGAVSLQDARGQVLERRQVRYVKGMNTMQWNISGYAAGTYYVVLENTGAKNIEVVKQ
jgi:Secretion system C-terminal sorting domain